LQRKMMNPETFQHKPKYEYLFFPLPACINDHPQLNTCHSTLAQRAHPASCLQPHSYHDRANLVWKWHTRCHDACHAHFVCLDLVKDLKDRTAVSIHTQLLPFCDHKVM
jgi:hypothetical protein